MYIRVLILRYVCPHILLICVTHTGFEFDAKRGAELRASSRHSKNSPQKKATHTPRPHTYASSPHTPRPHTPRPHDTKKHPTEEKQEHTEHEKSEYETERQYRILRNQQIMV